MKEEIEHRIKTLTLERNALEINHNALIKQNQKLNEEFQQAVMKNQTRFAQLTGAIQELTQLVRPQGGNNEPINTNRSYTATYGNPDRIPGGLDSDRSHSGVNLGD